MQQSKHTSHSVRFRTRLGLGVALLLLLSGDLILTPHAPLHGLPQFGVYMLVTLAGTGVVLGS